MNSDLTFFTNEPGASLLDRFKTILKHVQYFDVLVGYFRTSGFHRIYEALEDIDKIRVLVGLLSKYSDGHYILLRKMNRHKTFSFTTAVKAILSSSIPISSTSEKS